MASTLRLLFCLTLITATWCANTGTEASTTKSPTPAELENKRLTDSVNSFGYKLMVKMMQQNKDDNVVISPTSIAGLLAMTLLGSVGTTYEELADALGFSQDVLINRKNHENFGDLLQSLNTNDTTSKTLYADAVFIDSQSNLRNIFKDYLSRVYAGEAHTVDFKQSEEARKMINEWVKSHTEDKIEQFLKQTLPENTKAVLLSALYFSGQWKRPFLPEFTVKLPFKKPGNEVMADLMLNTGGLDHVFSKEDGLQMIALPYNDSTTKMYAIKPAFPQSLSLMELMEKLDYKRIDDLIEKMALTDVVLRYPKMNLESNINLEKPLKALGVNSIFNPQSANFALMVNPFKNKTENEIIVRPRFGEESKILKEMLNNLTNPGVYVDSVLHNVRITVNEFGTEAVAATAGILARSAVQFYVNTPFYMFIRNEKTKLVTFSAAIFDPTV